MARGSEAPGRAMAGEGRRCERWPMRPPGRPCVVVREDITGAGLRIAMRTGETRLRGDDTGGAEERAYADTGRDATAVVGRGEHGSAVAAGRRATTSADISPFYRESADSTPHAPARQVPWPS